MPEPRRGEAIRSMKYITEIGKQQEHIVEETITAKPHKKRLANIEALRLLAMLMVLSLHFLDKGKVLSPLTQSLDATGYLAWALEALSIAAVDVYVLISAYFLVETGFRCKRLISLICQVLFYTILIPVILIAIGVIDVSTITVYDILQSVLPVNMLQYWFVSAYVLMYLFTPVMNAAVHSMKRNQLKATIIIILLMESVAKTVLPVRLELDNLGYDCLWFLTVYLIAAYIRLYGIPFLQNGKKAAITYVIFIAAIYGLVMLVRAIYLQTGILENFISAPFGYNHLLTIMAAVAIFSAFRAWDFTGKAADAVCKLAPYTFGVYLIHEELYVRYAWPLWFGADRITSPLGLLGHWLLGIIGMLLLCSVIDFVRAQIFRLAGKWLAGTRLAGALAHVDQIVSGM